MVQDSHRSPFCSNLVDKTQPIASIARSVGASEPTTRKYAGMGDLSPEPPKRRQTEIGYGWSYPTAPSRGDGQGSRPKERRGLPDTELAARQGPDRLWRGELCGKGRSPGAITGRHLTEKTIKPRIPGSEIGRVINHREKMILGDASSSTLGPASDDFLFPSPNAPRIPRFLWFRS